MYRRRLQDFTTEAGRGRHLVAFFGDKPAESLTIFDVDGEKGYRAHRRKQGKRRGGGELRPATLNREVTLAKRVLNFAVRENLITRNPIAHAPDEPEFNIQQTKVETEEKLAALTAEASPLVEAMILCWFETGARRLEIMRLRWDQIEGSYLVFPKTKNRTPRRVKLAPRAMYALKTLPRRCEYVFANPATERPYNPRHLSRLFERAVTAAGLTGINGERVTPHKMRHGFTYRARRKLKLQEKTVMAMLGQKTRAAFDRYGITDEEETEEAWDVVALGENSRVVLDRMPPQRAQRLLPNDAVPSRVSRA